ncbi:MAG: lysophospholipid acyltransferase (LPLAT)-like uncharacterized protein [Granulosicoccus sp.]|jgi:lysophospholipid acyltransferase (LPLAT)-like uncharacterized protein
MNLKRLRRRLGAKILPPIVWGLIRIIWKTCRIEVILNSENVTALLEEKTPFIPCYWHQQQIFCVRYLLDIAKSDSRLKLGYLISPSADGDIATTMFGSQGVHIIRGSATRGGAQALREIYLRIKQDGISPIVTPDGPTGPIYECKPGVAMLAQLSRVPMLPLAYSSSSTWKLKSWDRFMLPRPFSRIVIGVGKPLHVNREDSKDEFAGVCSEMNHRLNEISATCSKRI